MKKRIIALFICAIMCLGVLAGCGGKNLEERGQSITVYLSENIYDFDPAKAYNDESTLNIVSLLFDTLFRLDENGKVQKSLAKKYYIEEDANAGEYTMYIQLKDTSWSDGTAISADDVVYAWKRILDVENSYPAASLLYDIKNAREAKQGEVSIDDVGIYAEGTTLLSIKFNQPIDYDQFVYNLTSLALAPLREDVIRRYGEDWAKKSSSMLCSGPFKLSRTFFAEVDGVKYTDINYDNKITENKVTTYVPATEPKDFNEQIVTSFVIERNNYYYRENTSEVSYMKSVTPYKIIVDCSMSDEDIYEAYKQGAILYMGDIPMSLRGIDEVVNSAKVEDSLSTHTYYLNENAYIDDGSDTGSQLFAIKEIRQALSMTIDREAIAKAVVFASVADGLVPNKVAEATSTKTTFRDACTAEYKYLVKNTEEAKKLIASTGIEPSKYSFSITVAAYDDVHCLIADMVCSAWCELGFNVTVNRRGTVANNDFHKIVEDVPKDLCDNLYLESALSGDYDVLALDMVAYSADPFSVLAPFAKEFSGMGMKMSGTDQYKSTSHITGYDSEEYNALISRIFDMKNIDSRAENYRTAEAILMEDMPVIPIVYNQYAYLDSGSVDYNNKVLFWSQNTDYYTTTYFTKAEVKDYNTYLANSAAYLEKMYGKYSENKMSYFYNFTKTPMNEGIEYTFEDFKNETSIYSFLFPESSK